MKKGCKEGKNLINLHVRRTVVFRTQYSYKLIIRLSKLVSAEDSFHISPAPVINTKSNLKQQSRLFFRCDMSWLAGRRWNIRGYVLFLSATHNVFIRAKLVSRWNQQNNVLHVYCNIVTDDIWCYDVMLEHQVDITRPKIIYHKYINVEV